jgi:hypothetical protein
MWLFKEAAMDTKRNKMLSRRPPRLAALATGLVVTGLAVVGASLASDSSSNAANRQLIELISEATTINHFVDVGEAGPSPGDSYAFSDRLFSPDSAQQVGRADGHCTLIAPSARRFTCTITSSLEEGDITTEWILVFIPGAVNVGAVTGGTGAYANARGEVTLKLGPVVGMPGARHHINGSLILIP